MPEAAPRVSRSAPLSLLQRVSGDSAGPLSCEGSADPPGVDYIRGVGGWAVRGGHLAGQPAGAGMREGWVSGAGDPDDGVPR